jgi:predicted ATPase
MLGRNDGTATQIKANVATASGTSIAAGGNGVGTSTFLDFDGFINTTATGNLVTQYAQEVAEATNLTIQFGSWLEVVKVV